MTVQQLIDQLQALNMPHARVVTSGFDESGFDDVGTVLAIQVVLHDERSLGHVGRHDEYQTERGGRPEHAVLINFET